MRSRAAQFLAVLGITAVVSTGILTSATEPAFAAPGDRVSADRGVHSADSAEEITPGGPPPEDDWTPHVRDELNAEESAQEQAAREAEVGEQAALEAEAQVLSTSVPLNAGIGIVSSHSYEEFSLFGSALDLQVNIGSGNLFARSELMSLGGPGIPASISAVYNSNTDTTNSDLYNWSTDRRALGLETVGSSKVYHDGTGARFTFQLVNGQWQAPADVNATLAASGSNFVLTYNRTGDKITFSSNGYLISRTDRNDVGMTYGYVDATRDTVTDAAGKSLRIEYYQGVFDGIWDGTDRIFYYDTVGVLRTIPTGNGTLQLSYSGRLLTRIILGDKQADITYEGRRVKTVTQTQTGQTPLVTTFNYTSSGTTITDARGGTSTFTVDGNFRVTAAVDQINRNREQEWTPNGDVSMTTSGFATGSQGAQTASTFDALNNQTSVTLPTGAATQAIYAQGANCAGAQTTHPYLPKCTIDDAGNSESMTYDTAGNLTQRKNTTSGSAAETFTYTYGSACGGMAGQICTAVDGNGKTTSYTYSAGLLTKVTPPAPLGATTYTYDAVGRVATVTNGAGHKTTYAYNHADEIVTTTFNNGATLTSQYNADGSLKQEVDSATGTTIAYTYNVLGLQTKQTTTSSTSGYNQMSTMTYDANGNLTRLYDSVGAAEAAYTYDAANQLTRIQLQGGNCTATNNPGCIRYEYDSTGAETARLFPFGARQDTVRDASSRPTRITTKNSAGVVQNDIAYTYALAGEDTGSVRTRTSHKEQGITAGAVTTYAYDSRSRLTNATEKVGTTTSASWAYQYDKADNRTRQVRTGSTGATAGTINYTYNNANQLASATGSSGSWTYDAAGNQTRNALTGVSSTYGDRLQVTANGSTAYTTFGQGNGQQLKVGTAVQKQSALGTYSTRDGHFVTRDNNGAAMALRMNSAQVYFATDHLGSVIGLFGPNGAYYGGYSYSPYGEARSTTVDDHVQQNDIRYIGQRLEPATGLYKLGARYYDAGLGRFTQMDPSGQERNPYAYAACDPINNLDPTGLVTWQQAVGACFEGMVGGIALGAAVGALTGGAAIVAALGMGCAGGIIEEWIVQNLGIPSNAITYVELLRSIRRL